MSRGRARPSRRARRRQRARRTWAQRFVLTVNVVAIIATLTLAGGIRYFENKLSKVERVGFGRDVLDDVASGDPQNYLIVGNDSDEGLAPDDPIRADRPGGVRSDSIMILRIDPKETKARLLSFPRDLWVEIAGTGTSERINGAFRFGEDTLPLTIKQNFGIDIHHYIEINFHGFQELVKAIDGVPINFPEKARDVDAAGDGSGFKIDAGCSTLDPVTALAFSRSRHYQVFRDGKWRSDPESDLGRIKRQQFFIEQAVQRAVEKGARNPATLRRLIDVGVSNVRLDNNLSTKDLVGLGKRFKDFDPGSLEKYSLPVVDRTVAGAQVLDLKGAEAEPILNLFRGVDPGTVTPSGVRVQVRNGSGTPGLAKGATEQLAAAGFATEAPSDADPSDGTVVRFAPTRAAQAQLVARHLEAPVIFEEVAGLEVDVVVVAGATFAGVRAEAKPASDVPAPPTSTPTTPSTLPGTTTTTVPAGATPAADFVPDAPSEGMSCP